MNFFNGFVIELENIYRLRIPFEELYTSVFLLKDKGLNILVDTATTDTDVENVIVPALLGFGVAPSEIDYLVLTHNHSDHAGGRERLLALAPQIKVIENKADFTFSDNLKTVALYGHTLDSIGVFDKRSNTLISGDGVQGYGIGKYRCSLASSDCYKRTLSFIKINEDIKNILFSHAYEPWNCDKAVGRERVLEYINICLSFLESEK